MSLAIAVKLTGNFSIGVPATPHSRSSHHTLLWCAIYRKLCELQAWNFLCSFISYILTCGLIFLPDIMGVLPTKPDSGPVKAPTRYWPVKLLCFVPTLNVGLIVGSKHTAVQQLVAETNVTVEIVRRFRTPAPSAQSDSDEAQANVTPTTATAATHNLLLHTLHSP